MIAIAARILKSNAAGFCVALVLAGILLVKATQAFPYQFGIDFYQFWGIPLAKKASGAELSPYVDPAGYMRVLNDISDASGSPKLQHANRFWHSVQPMGTPFLYAAFALFPADYEHAQALFATLQYLAAGVGLFLLARLRGIGIWPAICIALLVEPTFNPFVQDVKVGNVNSMQLAFLAALLHVALRRLYSGNVVVDGLFVGLLAVFVAFKPNTPWIALALGTHYWVTLGHRKFLVALGVAAVLTVLVFACGAWYFGDAHVWREWFEYVRGIDGNAHPWPLEAGNLSLPMLLSRHSGSYGPSGYGLIIALSLLVALLMAMSSNGRRSDFLVATALKAFSNPWFAASIGVLFTFATSPLLWPHYHLLALIPIFWLFRNDDAPVAGRWGAVICYCSLSTPLIDVLIPGSHYEVLQAIMLFSWGALIPGVFAYVAGQHRSLQAAPLMGEAARDSRPAGSQVIRELRLFGSYAAAGVVATAAHYAVMVALVTWAGSPEVVATCIGFLAGACVKYPLNYWAVFASRQRHPVAVPRFVLGLAVGFVLNALMFAVLLRALDLHYMLSQVLATGAVLFVNYLLARCWIFLARTGRGEKKTG